MTGWQDSTVLAYVMKTLNERYSYGLKLFLLSIDEGITGYRDDSLEVFIIVLTCPPGESHFFKLLDSQAQPPTILNAAQNSILR